MNAVLKKLGLADQNPVLIMNAPDDYNEVMAEIKSDIHADVRGKYKFIQIFAKNYSEACEYTGNVVGALDGDGHLWPCYPKGTSKKYKADIKLFESH